MPGRLADKVIVVTGATKGIGRGIALTLSGEGARVVVAGRNEEQGAAVVAEIEKRHGPAALFVKSDVARVDECRRLIEAAAGRFGRIDGLVNNAGIFPRALIEETEESLFDEVFNVNIKGALFCAKYFMRHLLAGKRGGSIVNIGSSHAYGGLDELTVYACSKGALLSLTKQIAFGYADRRIRCNWITVGWVVTEGELELRRTEGRLDWLKQQAGLFIPSGSFQTEADIGLGCVYLLSDESRNVTGTEMHISGGYVPLRHNPVDPPFQQRVLFYRNEHGGGDSR